MKNRILLVFVAFLMVFAIAGVAIAEKVGSKTQGSTIFTSGGGSTFGGGGGRSFGSIGSTNTTTTATTGNTFVSGGNTYRECTYTSGGQSYSYCVLVSKGTGGNAAPAAAKSPTKNVNLKPNGKPVDDPDDPTPPGGGGGGIVCPTYYIDIYAPDFSIAEICPMLGRKGQRELIGVNVVNNGRADAKTSVYLKIGNEVVQMQDVFVPAYGNHALSFGYYTPQTVGTPTVEVYVNPQHPPETVPYSEECTGSEDCDDEGNCSGCDYSCTDHTVNTSGTSPHEYDYSDNGYSGVININELPIVPNPKDPIPEPINKTNFIADLPTLQISETGGTGATLDEYMDSKTGEILTLGNNRTTLREGWIDSTPTGKDQKYNARLNMSVKVMDRTKLCNALKSGYGFSLQVTCEIDTDYPISDTTRLEAPKQVMCYIPDWGNYEHAVQLERTDGGGAYAKKTTWALPVNERSQTSARKWYTPIWWPDKTDYNVLVAAKGCYTPGGELTAASIHTIKIDSNMYTDDYSIN